jgi:hypothetical protein
VTVAVTAAAAAAAAAVMTAVTAMATRLPRGGVVGRAGQGQAQAGGMQR